MSYLSFEGIYDGLNSVMAYDYFYDAQMKRYLQQIVHGFSGLKYRTGRVINGSPEERVVPCRPATQSRMVASIMRAGENSLLTVPIITVWRSGLQRAPQNDHNHTFRGTLQVAERSKDENGNYGSSRGQGYTIERLMPVPFEMTVQIDIWTSNMDQKDQLLEQILVMAGREFDIQNSDNALDWAALTTMRLSDIMLTNRAFPIGTEDEIDIATLTYTLPIFLNPPAKITRQVLIHEVRTNVDNADTPTGQGGFARSIVTPGDFQVAVQRGVITLLGNDHMPKPWTKLGDAHRVQIQSGVTEFRLRKNGDADAAEIVGTLYATEDDTMMDWQIDIDTLPSNTLPPVDGIIRPLQVSPGNGLPSPASGQRYIVYEDMGTTEAWGTVNAKANEIIEFSNGAWRVATHLIDLDGSLLLNISSGSQLRWNGDEWEKAIDGIYGPGYWRILI